MKSAHQLSLINKSNFTLNKLFIQKINKNSINFDPKKHLLVGVSFAFHWS